jgi:tetratricopeptide (TPR) repeat protein
MRNTSIIITTFFISLTVICQICSAQTSIQLSSQMAAANELFKAQKWSEAADAYEQVLKSENSNGVAWSNLGSARYWLKQYQPAADAFEKSVAINASGFTMYNLACVYSLLGQKDKAIEWLTKTVDDPKMILPALNFNDPDLAAIKDDARFKALAERVDRKIHPCKFSDESKQFDFWVGEWDVYNPQGRKTGTSIIQSIAGGCGVLENWTDGFGGSGKSINFYDPTDHKWYQYWVGQNNAPARYAGIYRDGALRYIGEPSVVNGKKIVPRLTFFNIDANTVRQFAESSNDDGKTWTPVYDFKYVRKTQNK